MFGWGNRWSGASVPLVGIDDVLSSPPEQRDELAEVALNPTHDAPVDSGDDDSHLQPSRRACPSTSAARIDATSPGGTILPVTPSRTRSFIPVFWVTTKYTPHERASRGASPSPSWSDGCTNRCAPLSLSLIHISEPTRLLSISYAVF